MPDKSRERNYVDAFSDYGLDERQTAIQNKIMTKCFKILFYGVAILTCIWIFVPAFTEFSIPCQYIALSYFLLATFCNIIYIIRASKHGAINGITAFSWKSKGQIVISLFVFAPLLIRILTGNTEIDENIITIIVLGVLGVTYNIVMHFCGRRNFEVLDEEVTEDTDESEEE